MGLSSGGSVEQKLQGSFMLFDKDHNGELERSEVIGCFQTLLHSSLYKHYVETHGGKKPKELSLSDSQKNEIATIVGELFDNLDVDKVCSVPLLHHLLLTERSFTFFCYFTERHNRHAGVCGRLQESSRAVPADDAVLSASLFSFFSLFLDAICNRSILIIIPFFFYFFPFSPDQRSFTARGLYMMVSVLVNSFLDTILFP